MSFESGLAEMGFEMVGDRRGGTARFVRRSGPYLQWWLYSHADGTADLSWELELGSFLKDKGFHVSVQDELSLLLFPPDEKRGPADADWIEAEMVRTEGELRSVNLVEGL